MKAVLKNGVIQPQEPVPQDWDDGTELRVEKYSAANEESFDDLDRWLARVQASADQMDPADEIVLEKSLREIRDQARELARKAPEEAAFASGMHPTDVWMDEVEAIAAQGDPEDDKRLDAAIQDIRRREKELARKKLGLEP